jgi:hypothetical protein
MSLTLVVTPVVAWAASTVSSATPIARSLLNRAILPTNALLAHPDKAVVCQCAGTPDAQYLVSIHRYYVVPGSPSSVESFLAAHVPKGGTQGGEGSSGAILWSSTAFPADGPHVYVRQLAYSMTSRNTSSTWLRVDSQIVWIPSRSSSQFIAKAVSATVTGYQRVGLDGSSGANKVHVAGAKLTALIRTLNALPLGPQNGCMEELIGFNLTITLHDRSTIDVSNGFCGDPSEYVSTLKGDVSGPRYSLSDTSCALIKQVVTLFDKASVTGTRDALRACETWIRHPVA